MNPIHAKPEIREPSFSLSLSSSSFRVGAGKIESPFLKMLQSTEFFRETFSDPVTLEPGAFSSDLTQEVPRLDFQNPTPETQTSTDSILAEKNLAELTPENSETVTEVEEIEDDEDDPEMIEEKLQRKFQESNLSRRLPFATANLSDGLTKQSEVTIDFVKKESFPLSAKQESGQPSLQDQTNGKHSRDTKEWENKILTSQDLWEKIRSDETLQGKASPKAGEKKPEISINILNKTANESKVKVADSNESVRNETKIEKDEKEKWFRNLTEKNRQEISAEPAKDRKVEVDLRSPSSVKERVELQEKPLDGNRWEIQKERNQRELRTDNFQHLRSGVSSTKADEGSPLVQSALSSSRQEEQKGFANEQGRQSFQTNLVRSRENSAMLNSGSLSPAEKRENFENLIRQAKIQILGNQKSQAEIRMNPEELGRMVLKISVNQDKVEGKIFVESESLKLSLQSDMPQLKEELKQQGLRLESLEIDVAFREDQDLAERSQESREWKGPSRGKEVKAESPEPTKRSDALLDIIA